LTEFKMSLKMAVKHAPARGPIITREDRKKELRRKRGPTAEDFARAVRKRHI